MIERAVDFIMILSEDFLRHCNTVFMMPFSFTSFSMTSLIGIRIPVLLSFVHISTCHEEIICQ